MRGRRRIGRERGERKKEWEGMRRGRGGDIKSFIG